MKKIRKKKLVIQSDGLKEKIEKRFNSCDFDELKNYLIKNKIIGDDLEIQVKDKKELFYLLKEIVLSIYEPQNLLRLLLELEYGGVEFISSKDKETFTYKFDVPMRVWQFDTEIYSVEWRFKTYFSSSTSFKIKWDPSTNYMEIEIHGFGGYHFIEKIKYNKELFNFNNLLDWLIKNENKLEGYTSFDEIYSRLKNSKLNYIETKTFELDEKKEK